MEDWIEIIVPIAAMVGIVVVAGGILFVIDRFRRRPLVALAEALGARVKGIISTTIIVENQGAAVKIWTQARSKYTPPYLYFEQDRGPSFKLTVDARGWLSAITFRLDGLREMATADPMFDKALKVRTNDPARAGMFLMNDARKAAVQMLFGAGFDGITAKPSRTKLRLPNYKDKDLDPDVIRNYLECLRSLSEL